MKKLISHTILLFQVLSFACAQNKKTETEIIMTNENVELINLTNKNSDISDNWKKVEACGLSFFVPMDLKEIKVQPIDSCVREYRNQNTIIEIDSVDGADESGSRKNEYVSEKDFVIINELIDGQKAEIISYYRDAETGFKERKGLFYGVVLYIPNVNEKNSLTIWTYSRSAEERENVSKIFRTIKFEK